MKPFNLEAAMRGEPVVTRAGAPVAQLTNFNVPHTSYPVFGIIEGEIRTWTLTGKYRVTVPNHENDLFMVSKEKTGFINIYPLEHGLGETSNIYPTRAAADEGQRSIVKRVACVEVSWEE